MRYRQTSRAFPWCMKRNDIDPEDQRRRHVIHLVTLQRGAVVSGCGDWSRSPNWTTERRVVTCPRCLLRPATQPAEEPVDAMRPA